MTGEPAPVTLSGSNEVLASNANGRLVAVMLIKELSS
jgi:hypothetical protein